MKRKQFEEYLRSGTANNITVGVLAAIGLICGAKSFTGTQISLVEYCFIPETLTLPVNRLRYCTPDKRYIMPESEFNGEVYAPANPEFQRDNFLPTKATRLRIIPPSNPDKPWWGLGAVVMLSGAYGLSKAREWRLLQLIPELREEIRSNWLIAKLKEGLRLHKESYTAQLDYEFHQWSENRRVRAAQLSKMSPEELAIFQEQVRLKAEAEARAQMQQATGQPAGALPGQSMQDIARGDDKVTGSEQTAIANSSSWVQNLVKQTALIWGNQGGGKSWLARYVALKKKQAGYRVIVLDPDSNRAEWRGVESYHSWSDIEQQIRDYVKELESRLKTFNNSSISEEQWRQKLWSEGKALSLICEEATTYGDFIKDEELLSKFGKLALTKSRKQEMPLTVVAHNNTQTCLFGIKGLYNLVSKMLQVECLAEVDTITLQPKSTGKAKVKLDSSNEWLDVNLPTMTAKISDFSDTTPAAESNPNPPIDQATLERIYELEINIGGKAGDTKSAQNKLSPQAQKLYEYLIRTERIEADVREFKGNFKVNSERFTVEQIKGWMDEIVGAGLANWIAEGVIKLNQI